MNDPRQLHQNVIMAFLDYINAHTGNFILKGGTALLACYGLDRFSEDIDFDSKLQIGENIIPFVERFCLEKNYDYWVAKNTDTVKRCMIHYNTHHKPLKIEVSHRRREIPDDETTIIKNIAVYKLEPLCIMKVNAYAGRDKMRDLYDLTFICNNFFDQLSMQAISLIRNAIEYKGIEHFDFLMKDQRDELINSDKLTDDFLRMYDHLGLLYDENEKQIVIKQKQPGSQA
jgi:predicted nucleotidyltransferase component of viral defense system